MTMINPSHQKTNPTAVLYQTISFCALSAFIKCFIVKEFENVTVCYNLPTMKIKQYNVIFKPEPEGGFTVVVPSLPGCVTYGKDLIEAKSMAKDAIEAYISSLAKHHELIPSDDNSLTSFINITVNDAKVTRSFASSNC
jgi:predicted RNase H-like HicB family nuclease